MNNNKDFESWMSNNSGSYNRITRLGDSMLFSEERMSPFKSLLKEWDLWDILLNAIEALEVLKSEDISLTTIRSTQRKKLIASIDKLTYISERLEGLNLNSPKYPLEYSSELSDKQKEVALRNSFQNIEVSRLIEDLDKELNHFYSIIESAIQLIFSKKFSGLGKELESFREIIENLNTGIAEKEKEAQRLLTTISQLPTKQHIDSYSKMFEIQADSFKKTSEKWLIGVASCLGGIVLVAIVSLIIFMFVDFSEKSVSQIVQINISKVLLITVLFYGLAICNKNYKSSKHHEILNMHRSNALASFQAFAESPSADSDTKNAVLLEATKTIYGIQQTGYVPAENDDSPNKVVELIQTIQSSKS